MIDIQPLVTLVRALGREGRRRLALLAALTGVSGLAEIALLASLLGLVREWFGIGEAPRANLLMVFALAVLAAGSLRLALLAATQKLAQETGHRWIVAVQRRVLARDWLTHAAAKGSGPITAIELVEQVLYGLLLPLLQGAAAIVIALAIFGGLLWIDAAAAAGAALILGTLFLVVTLAVGPVARQAGAALGQGYEARTAAVQEHVGALRELILAGARGAASDRFQLIDHALSTARTNLAIVHGAPRILVETLGLVALALIGWWLAGRPGGVAAAIPTLAALALGAQRLLPLFQAVSQAIVGLSSSRYAAVEVAALLDQPTLPKGPRPDPLPFSHQLSLDGVSFAYPGREEAAVRGVGLVITRGERIALTGRSGSGKSTLADLVMGLLLPQEGRILVDGLPLTPARIPAWQRNIAHVPQSPFLLDGSISANIAFMDGAPDDARVQEAARLAGLDELIASLPLGFETRVGDRGQLMSGGQRQRLALARALYSPAPLLVLDEATSALDPESERHVLAALRSLQNRGTAILLIAHRATMLEGCDRVVRLEEGRIASVQAASAQPTR